MYKSLKAPSLCVCIVTFNSEDTLKECIQSVFRFLGPDAQIVVADNGSSDNTLHVARSFPTVEVLDLGENKGFGSANNAIFAHRVADAYYILNPDTKLTNSPMPAIMFAVDNPNCGVVGTRIVWPDGREQSASYSFLSLRKMLVQWIVPKEWHVYARKLMRLSRSISSGAGECDFERCDWVTGASMIISRNSLAKLGGFAESFFLYFEDQDLCKRAANIGLACYHCTGATVEHSMGWKTDKTPYRRELFFNGLETYLKAHISNPISRRIISSLAKTVY